MDLNYVTYNWWCCVGPCLCWKWEIRLIFVFLFNTLLVVTANIALPVESLKGSSCWRWQNLYIKTKKKTKIKKYIYTHQSNYFKNSTSIIKLWENVQNRTRKQRPLIIFIKSTQVFQILDKNSSSIQHKYKLNPSEAHPRERNSNPKLLYHPGVESRNLNPRTLLPSRCHTPEFLYHPGKILPIEPTSRDMTW